MVLADKYAYSILNLKLAEESLLKRQCSHSNWNIASGDRRSAIYELLAGVEVSDASRELLSVALETRECAEPTIVHPGIAMPHCRSILVDDIIVVLARSERGIPWPDEMVNVIILFISPVKPTGSQKHMELIRHLARYLRNGGAEVLLEAGSAGEAAAVLRLDMHGSEEDEQRP